jgi:uncharacterized protein
MHFNVSQFIREASGSTRRVDVDEPVAFTNDEKIVVAGTVRFVRTNQGVWVTARLHAEIATECGRCLDEYPQPVDVTIDEEAVPRLDFVTGDRLLADDELEQRLMIDEAYVLDLTEATRQYVALGLPMQPLCEPDCRGLCSTCGANHNRKACTCDQVQRDSRWRALLEMVPAIETELRKN